jgi:hypothetical protein
MDHPVTADYDANILYPAPLRDLFIRLAQAGLVQVKWTDAIHEEWMRNVLKDRPDLSPQRPVCSRLAEGCCPLADRDRSWPRQSAIQSMAATAARCRRNRCSRCNGFGPCTCNSRCRLCPRPGPHEMALCQRKSAEPDQFQFHQKASPQGPTRSGILPRAMRAPTPPD